MHAAVYALNVHNNNNKLSISNALAPAGFVGGPSFLIPSAAALAAGRKVTPPAKVWLRTSATITLV